MRVNFRKPNSQYYNIAEGVVGHQPYYEIYANFSHAGMILRGNEKIVRVYLDWLKVGNL